MVAAVGGFSVGGIVGALFAVPTFGAIKAVAVRMRDGRLGEPTEAPPPSEGTWHRLRRWMERRRSRSS
jgi:predicted PurR-regulated permease PerM